MAKRIVMVVLATLCFLFLVAGVGSAAIDTTPSDLTVVIEYGDEPLEGILIAICQVAQPVEQGDGIIYEATSVFSGAGADFSDLSTDSNIALAALLDAYASANAITRLSAPTNDRGGALFQNLPPGLYLVAQVDAAGNEYDVSPYLVALPSLNPLNKTVEYRVTSYPKTAPTKHSSDFISVSVFKVWAGSGTNHPDKVQVQLYRNGINNPYGGIVTLDAANYWSHTWDDLSASDSWTVEEVDVPPGYTRAISGGVSNGFVITNTKGPSNPDQPTQPVVPNPQGKPGSPKTGDPNSLSLWVVIFIVSAFGLVAVTGVLNSQRLVRVLARG